MFLAFNAEVLLRTFFVCFVMEAKAINTVGSSNFSVSNQQQQQQKKGSPAWFAISLVLLGALIVFLFSLLGVERTFTFTPKDGISAFAIVYLQAQLIERLVEPFSETKLTKSKDLFGNTDSIKAARRTMARNERLIDALTGMAAAGPQQMATFRSETANAELEIKQAKDTEDSESQKRVVRIWGITSLLGMILVYFTVGVFETVGATFQPWDFAGRLLNGHMWDAILSGIIVGAGTKPVHDLIEVLSKQEKKE